MHFGLSKVFVLPPEEMHFIATKVEAEIGQGLELPLSVSAHVNVDGKIKSQICSLFCFVNRENNMTM